MTLSGYKSTLRCGWREVVAHDGVFPLSHPTYGHCTNFLQKQQLDIELLLDRLHLVWYDYAQPQNLAHHVGAEENRYMSEIVTSCVYFLKAGPANTARTLELARSRAGALGLRKVLVATTTGATGAQATQALQGLEIVAVAHSTGFGKPDTQELTARNREAIEVAGGTILTCQDAFGGVGRAVRKRLGTYQVDEIIAFALRTLGEGIKVVAERRRESA